MRAKFQKPVSKSLLIKDEESTSIEVKQCKIKNNTFDEELTFMMMCHNYVLEDPMPEGGSKEVDLENDLLGSTEGEEDSWKHITRDQFIKPDNSKFRNCLGWLDYNDRVISRKFQLLDMRGLNEILGFGAWICNRKQCIFQLPLIMLWTYFSPEPVKSQFQYSNDYTQVQLPNEFSNSSKFKLSVLMAIYMCIGLVVFVLGAILPIKYLTKRSRPSRVPSVFRYCNMRDREGNQPSFPSGDAAVAAYFFSQFWFIQNSAWLFFIITPLVLLGRVYMQCHWFGDTTTGALLGYFFAILWYSSSTFGIISGPLFSIFF